MEAAELCKEIGKEIDEYLTNISKLIKNNKPSNTWKDKYRLALLIHLIIKKSDFQPNTKKELLSILEPIKRKFLKEIKHLKEKNWAEPVIEAIDDLLNYLNPSKAK